MAAIGPAGGALELWGGAECTVNRIGDAYRDQTLMTGHQHRPGDLDLFASLGIRKLRYPVLWERVSPDRPDRHDWAWSDERLARLRDLKVEPIVGLLHHGSGPRYTSLIDPDFPHLFGHYAAAVARRYPHVVDWTPVNEPLTTARFSALYGHWYPHARDERLFWGALLNQIDATRAAMRAIRAINPAARLVQTEDLGRCYATDTLTRVADHHNHRRWMTWDLLAGRVDRDHPLWAHVDAFGWGDRLRVIADDPCPADVIGVNHYLTSDRFIDDRPGAYPGPIPADGYHDVAAIRALDPAPPGLSGAIRDVWERYATPVAVTECHLGCTREEQVRWLDQAWRDCSALRQQGIDVRAVTAWALLGGTDWNSLLTRTADQYEVGAFDVRGGEPRLTAIGALLRHLGGRGPVPDGVTIVLRQLGWWRRDSRLEHPRHRWTGAREAEAAFDSGPPLLITGGTDGLGQAFARACVMRGIVHVLTDEADAMLDRHEPWAVIDAGGFGTDYVTGASDLVRACAARDIHCTLFAADPIVVGGDVLVMCGAAHDQQVPLDRVAEIVDFCLDLVIDGTTGIWDLADGLAVGQRDTASDTVEEPRLDVCLVP